MDRGLAGSTALISGGSRGIGFAAASSLAAEGCNLHLAVRSGTELLEGSCANLPFGRTARAGELGDVIAPLASARVSYVNGTMVTVDGGNNLRGR